MGITIKKIVKLSKEDLIEIFCEKYKLDPSTAEIVFETKTCGNFRDEYEVTTGIQITANEKQNK